MKKRSIVAALIGAGGAAFAAPMCLADYIGLTVQYVGQVTTAAGPKSVYRVYAKFTDPNDRMSAWGSTTSTPPTTISTGPCAPATPFYQAPGGYNIAPDQSAIDKNPDVRWDTFATIGVTQYEQGVPFDMTSLSPQFPPFINGGAFTLANKSVFVPGDQPQAHAGFAGDGDPALRVLLMQLTVEPETYVFGTIGAIWWMSPNNITHIAGNQTWNALEPPGYCCTPNGDCILAEQSTCAMFSNGYWLGCDECAICAATCLPDIVPPPGDGNVDIDDLFAVINAWGPCNPFSACPPDVAPDENGDDVVDVDDLFVVINNWGPCPR